MTSKVLILLKLLRETGETYQHNTHLVDTGRHQSLTLTDCDRHSIIFYIRCLPMRDNRTGWTFLNLVKSVSRKTESNYLASPRSVKPQL